MNRIKFRNNVLETKFELITEIQKTQKIQIND